jgi:hypothetical protein
MQEQPTRPDTTREPERTPAPEPTPAPAPEEREPADTTRRPAPGIEHEPEPDAENLIPKKDGPGTL